MVAVALAGAAGALSRYVFDRAIMARRMTRFPVGTAVINLSGSLALGLVTGLVTHAIWNDYLGQVVGDGFIGAFTTFSTLTYETIALVEGRSWGFATLNMIGTVVMGLFLALLGLHLA
ncbi:MAG: fluoride efflux transporter FluC [Ferrimicrobium sp.]